MAVQTQPTSAQYRTQGGAAYDIYAKRVRLPDELPIEEEAPQQRPVVVRARMQVSLFSVIGLVIAAFLGVLVIFGYVRLYEVNSRISDLENEITLLQAEHGKLESTYESRIDLVEVERRAIALGMTQPRTEQKLYFDLGAEDHAVIMPAKKANFILRLADALRSSTLGFVEYLSAASS